MCWIKKKSSLNLNFWLACFHVIDCFTRLSVSRKICKGGLSTSPVPTTKDVSRTCNIWDKPLMKNFMFHKIYKQTERLAEKLHVELTLPRSVVGQMQRNNVPAENPEECYRRALTIPLVDWFIAEMNFRFNSFNKTASKLLLLVSSITCDPEYNDLVIEELIEKYSDDLLNPDVIDLELKLWKRKWSEVEKKTVQLVPRKQLNIVINWSFQMFLLW